MKPPKNPLIQDYRVSRSPKSSQVATASLVDFPSSVRSLDMEAAAKAFFATPRFAVAGASSDPAKFGHKSMTFLDTLY